MHFVPLPKHISRWNGTCCLWTHWRVTDPIWKQYYHDDCDSLPGKLPRFISSCISLEFQIKVYAFWSQLNKIIEVTQDTFTIICKTMRFRHMYNIQHNWAAVFLFVSWMDMGMFMMLQLCLSVWDTIKFFIYITQKHFMTFMSSICRRQQIISTIKVKLS